MGLDANKEYIIESPSTSVPPVIPSKKSYAIPSSGTVPPVIPSKKNYAIPSSTSIPPVIPSKTSYTIDPSSTISVKLNNYLLDKANGVPVSDDEEHRKRVYSKDSSTQDAVM